MTIARDVRDGQAGIRDVGTLAEYCVDLLAQASIDFPGRLLKLVVPLIPEGSIIGENGALTGISPDFGYLYVDGVLTRVETFVITQPFGQPGRKLHMSAGI